MAYRAAVIQLNSQPDLEHNIECCRKWIEKAAYEGADWIGLPENFFFLGDMKRRLREADTIEAAVYKKLSRWAAMYEVYLLGGGFPAKADNGKYYNRSILFDPLGEPMGHYDKIHLFDVQISKQHTYRESDIIAFGNLDIRLITDVNIGNIGQTICYDLRFPELYLKYGRMGAQVLTVPSAFTDTTGAAHWNSLLRARAIETQCYVLAPAQTGTHGTKRTTYGHACIVDPWGTIRADAGTREGFAIAEINLSWIDQVREKLPSHSHHRLH